VQEGLEWRRYLLLQHLVPVYSLAPRMLLDLKRPSLRSKSLLRVLLEQSLQQVATVFGEEGRDVYGGKEDIFVHLVSILREERRQSNQHFIE
jgi:hypothetical protein